ncbi:hypothetical protein I545_4520 [Mycobacterium kansasii 662]|uniref:Uncharacterized protein n=2 Tax=Mycobacterium kansasii TaxID=1768 RepID=A0A1V3WS49_MYCKA|nr:hypothetical protein I545_4520 [Mycobacterium kansasii 662]KEP44241.1 hypothetical protein MKSMC1_06020 [Mycobacterium kansasii]OOK69789.1 hypothetical protein BZL29_6376 [Mycobacterium kansasii]
MYSGDSAAVTALLGPGVVRLPAMTSRGHECDCGHCRFANPRQ